MATYTNLADFSSDGLNIGKDSRVMSYMHGLSDFWVYMFEDASKINLLLEANAITASDVYNKFLQLTSVISLEEISVLTNAQVKLILLGDNDLVDGTPATYTIPQDTDLKYAKYLVNRAFLPTAKLENEADYYIDSALGQISFAQPLSDLGFPFRTLSDNTKQYAIWAVDAKIDDNLIYDHYGKLINVDPTTSTENFRDFVYGMYYLFVQGPNLETIRRGLNIALGIPLARDVETVLEIRKYLNSDQWLVVTDRNSYLIPYGLAPTVELDDLLEVGQEIAQWIEVKDYISDGEWWVNFMLPSHLMPFIPPSVPGGGGVNADATPDRYMTAGSYADWLMRNYLKTHTFLVNVKTVGFKNIQNFEQLADVIRQVKPTYTAPIYVWTVPTGSDPIEFVETMLMSLGVTRCECPIEGISRFTRDSTNTLDRDCPKFIRMSGPGWLDAMMGNDPDLNQTRSFPGGNITGYIAPMRTFATLSNNQLGWLKALHTRSSDQYVPPKGRASFAHTYNSITDGQGVHPFAANFPGMRMVYLYTTTLVDVTEKFTTAGTAVPSDYYFTLFQPGTVMEAINVHPINDSQSTSYLSILQGNFNYYFTPGTWGPYLSAMFGPESYLTWKPTAGDVKDGDYLAFTRIADNCIGVFWITSNYTVQTPGYFPHYENDQFTISYSAPINRGDAALGYPFYYTRLGGSNVTYTSYPGTDNTNINTAIDEAGELTVNYSDNRNTSFAVDRSGKTLTLSRTWK